MFRNRERGALHAPEFTMLEWYRAGAPYEAVMDDCAALLKLAADCADNRFVSWRGVTSNPRAEPARLTVADAFARYSGIDLLGTVGDRDALAAAADNAGVTARADDTWADIFAKLLTALIEPKLGNGRPTLLIEYPASEAPLARVAPNDPRVAERFELYCCGVELANGFGELTDPEVQRRRLEAEMDKKQERLRRALPDRRGLHRRPGAHAAGFGLRHGLRPPRHAGDRRDAHRSGAVDTAAGRRVTREAPHRLDFAPRSAIFRA